MQILKVDFNCFIFSIISDEKIAIKVKILGMIKF